MAITLRHPGRVVVEDVDLSYAYGWLSGTQRIGGSVDLSWAGVRGS